MSRKVRMVRTPPLYLLVPFEALGWMKQKKGLTAMADTQNDHLHEVASVRYPPATYLVSIISFFLLQRQ